MGLPAPWVVALVLVCFVLAAIPTRRLWLAGIRPGWLSTYLLGVVVLGVVAVGFRAAARFVVPVLVVLYVAPLVVAPGTLSRLLFRGRRPPRSVGSGPGQDVGPDAPAAGSEGGRRSGYDADANQPPPRPVGGGPGRDVGPDDSPLP